MRSLLSSIRLPVLGAAAGVGMWTNVAAAELEPAEPVEELATSTGPELGLRLGYATAFGATHGGAPVTETISGAVPFWLDVGYRFAPRWFIGGYGQYGVGVTGASVTSSCENCQPSSVRVGLQLQYQWLRSETRSAWIGLGIGREFLNVSVDDERREAKSFRGWEWLNVQFGSEWQPIPGLGIGPFFSFALGSFDSVEETCLNEFECPKAERRVTTNLDSRFHGWVSAGLRIITLP